MAPSYAPPPNTSRVGVTRITPSLFSTTCATPCDARKCMRVEQALVESIEETRCRGDVAEMPVRPMIAPPAILSRRVPVDRSRKNADSASPSSTIQSAARPIDSCSNSTNPVNERAGDRADDVGEVEVRESRSSQLIGRNREVAQERQHRAPRRRSHGDQRHRHVGIQRSGEPRQEWQHEEAEQIGCVNEACQRDEMASITCRIVHAAKECGSQMSRSRARRDRRKGVGRRPLAPLPTQRRRRDTRASRTTAR